VQLDYDKEIDDARKKSKRLRFVPVRQRNIVHFPMNLGMDECNQGIFFCLNEIVVQNKKAARRRLWRIKMVTFLSQLDRPQLLGG
jgi:hypothetical protein